MMLTRPYNHMFLPLSFCTITACCTDALVHLAPRSPGEPSSPRVLIAFISGELTFFQNFCRKGKKFFLRFPHLFLCQKTTC